MPEERLFGRTHFCAGASTFVTVSLCRHSSHFSKMVFVRTCDIPDYLVGSALYLSFDESDGSEMEISSQFLKRDMTLKSYSDLVHLLHTMRYWGIDNDIPIEVFQFVHSFGHRCDYRVVMAKFPEYRMYLAKVLNLKDSSTTAKTARAVSLCMGPAILKYLHKSGFPLTAETAKCAAYVNDLECLQYHHTNGGPWDDQTTTTAAQRGSLECFQYAYEHGCSITNFTILEAVCSGHLNCIEYMRSKDVPFHLLSTAKAATHGHLHVLQYLHRHSCPWGRITCDEAARHNQLECLRFAHEHGSYWDESTCLAAAAKGNTQCLQYAHSHGCPWDRRTCAAAALGNHLSCLQYAHEHGCIWDKQTLYSALWNHSWRCAWYTARDSYLYTSLLYLFVLLGTLVGFVCLAEPSITLYVSVVYTLTATSVYLYMLEFQQLLNARFPQSRNVLDFARRVVGWSTILEVVFVAAEMAVTWLYA